MHNPSSDAPIPLKSDTPSDAPSDTGAHEVAKDAPTAAPMVRWLDADDQPQQAVWRSLAGHAPFERVVLVDDATPADDAYRMARAGTGLLWVGDYQNARHLLQALGRRLKARIDGRRVAKPDGAAPALPALGSPAMAEAFAAQRREQNERTRILGALLLPFDADHGVPLRRAPDVREAGLEAHGVVNEPYVASLRELQGVIGAHEWRKTGVPVAALKDNIYPHHGVFSPVRGEYVDLVARTKLPAAAKPARALELGCGSGVLCAVLARRGLWVVATDVSPAALACSEDNLTRLELKERVTLLPQSLYPKGRFGLVVCNPPWVPGPAGSALDGAVYDPDSRMLRGFLDGLAAHLAPGGEGWLILSDLAEHLGLRSREELLGWISAAGLQVLGRTETPPVHARASDAADPLHRARAAEMTSLWRLGRAEAPAPALS